uniref:Uncharacterized protein n=1 Tax=Tanacetum cinerariifolium TaxID=118510 RepID=A0A6L2MC95_TANCI|nr:hypothetical protein [Tanacetum cinerariifolium]
MLFDVIRKYADILSTMSSADIDVAVNVVETIGKKFQDKVNKAGGMQLSSSLKVSTSPPLVSLSTTINVPCKLNSIDVTATFRVPLTTFVDLHKLINDIEADKYEELSSGMTNGDRMETLDALDPMLVQQVQELYDQVNSNFRPLVADPVLNGVNISIPCKVIEKKSNDGLQTVGKKKKRKGKSKSTNDGQFTSPFIKQTVRYDPKSTTIAPKKGATNVNNPSKSSSMLKTMDTSPKNDNFTTSNSFFALNDEEEEDEEVENVYDESDNLVLNTNIAGSSSFTVGVG